MRNPGRTGVETCVLIPGPGQPVCREGFGQRTADDKAEKPAAGGGERRRRHRAVKQRQRLALGARACRERLIELPQRRRSLRIRRHGALVEAVEIGARAARSIVKNGVHEGLSSQKTRASAAPALDSP